MNRSTNVIRFSMALGMTLFLSACRSPAVEDQSHLLHEAQLMLRGNMPSSALATYGVALDKDPSLVDAHMGMGAIYRNWENPKLAQAAYRRATLYSPNSFDAHYWYGRMTQKLGDLTKTLKIYLRALEIDPNHAQTHRLVANLYYDKQDIFHAIDHAKRVTDLTPKDAAAWHLLGVCYAQSGRYQEAIHAYNISARGNISEKLLVDWFTTYAKQEKHSQAVSVLNELCKRYPKAHYYQRTGFHYYELAREQVALKHVQKANDFFEKALERFKKTLTLDKENIKGLNGVGYASMNLYYATGQIDQVLKRQALDAWRMSLDIKKDQPKIQKMYRAFR